MLKMICLTVLMLIAAPVMAQDRGSAESQSDQSMGHRVWDVMALDLLMPILRDEALIEAESMEAEVFQRDNSSWLDAVAQIHDPARLQRLFESGLTGISSDTAQDGLEAALSFYRTSLGQRLIGLETSARQAMLDPDTEASARTAFAEAASREDPRVSQIARLIEEGDLIGPNVAGGLNAALAFSQGFADGGGFDMPLTENQMLADAWAQEPSIRAETLGWMEAYLMLAYSPLNDAELERYIRFAGSDAGQALSAALFAGFDAMFLQTSRDLGLAAAGQIQGREL